MSSIANAWLRDSSLTEGYLTLRLLAAAKASSATEMLSRRSLIVAIKVCTLVSHVILATMLFPFR